MRGVREPRQHYCIAHEKRSDPKRYEINKIHIEATSRRAQPEGATDSCFGEPEDRQTPEGPRQKQAVHLTTSAYKTKGSGICRTGISDSFSTAKWSKQDASRRCAVRSPLHSSESRRKPNIRGTRIVFKK